MKKVLTLLIAILAFTTLSFAQKSSFTVQAGYSISSGLVGAEYQYGKISVAAGWMPLRMPESHEIISSFSAAITAYNYNWNESGWYASAAFASKAYRSEDIVSPMMILSLGYKTPLCVATGLGVGEVTI